MLSSGSGQILHLCVCRRNIRGSGLSALRGTEPVDLRIQRLCPRKTGIFVPQNTGFVIQQNQHLCPQKPGESVSSYILRGNGLSGVLGTQMLVLLGQKCCILGDKNACFSGTQTLYSQIHCFRPPKRGKSASSYVSSTNSGSEFRI